MSDRCLTLNLQKEKQRQVETKKQKIVLNAAIKVKAKEKTSNVIYNHKEEPMGKKEEFRLNWRVCSAGTLHQEFVLSKRSFRALEPLEVSVVAPRESLPHDDSVHCGDDDWRGDEEGGPPPSPPPLAESIHSDAPGKGDRESELMPLPQIRNLVKPVDNIVEIKAIEWQENDFSHNIPDKVIKKRKVVKTPEHLADEKKRKHENGKIVSFSVIEILFNNFKNTSFNRDLDFSYESKTANSYRRQLLLQHRKKYQAHLENEAKKDQLEDFRGFYNEDEDSENEHDFEGFDLPNGNDDVPEVEVPLPDKEDLMNGPGAEGKWQGDNPSSYDNEAMRTMEAYRSRKIDHNRMTDMARRVEEWHQKILPKLESAEERSGFDVHEYGSRILENFGGKVGTVKKFEEVVGGKPREEVARYFLSTLMLANQYNLEISETETGDLNTDCVQLKLLSTVRHHEELDDNLRHTSDKS